MNLFKSNMKITDIILIISFLREELRLRENESRKEEIEEQILALRLIFNKEMKDAAKEVAKEITAIKQAEAMESAQQKIEFTSAEVAKAKAEKIIPVENTAAVVKEIVVDAQTNLKEPVVLHTVEPKAETPVEITTEAKVISEKRVNTLKMREELKNLVLANRESEAIEMIKGFYSDEAWITDQRRIDGYLIGVRKELGQEVAQPKKEKPVKVVGFQDTVKPVVAKTEEIVGPTSELVPRETSKKSVETVVAEITNQQDTLKSKKIIELENFKAQAAKTVVETVTQEQVELERAAAKTKVIEHPATVAAKNEQSSAAASTTLTKQEAFEQRKGSTEFVATEENIEMSKAIKDLDVELTNIIFPGKNTKPNRDSALQSMKIFSELFPNSYIKRNLEGKNHKNWFNKYIDDLYSKAAKEAKIAAKRADVHVAAAV
jgi:hypothetical protein